MKPLTDVQKEILLHICLGRSQRQVAEMTYKTAGSLGGTVERIQDKMCVRNRAGMIAYTCLGHIPTEEELRKLINEL